LLTQTPRDVHWDDVLELHVVRKLAEIVRRRWNLGVTFADPDGRPVPGAEADRHRPPAPLCEVIQARPPGERACAEASLDVARQLRGHAAGQLARATCHAGLGQIAAPIVVDDRTLGFVWAGGFLVEGEGRRGLDDRLAELGADPASSHAAADRQRSLSPADLEYLGELVRLLAEEVATYQTQTLRGASRERPAQGATGSRYTYEGIVGHSRPMLELRRLLDKVIDSDSTVLVHGENGTGKELIAKAIHRNSCRKGERFVVQNCSAFNDNLLDSELFGHKKGAFTGAFADKQGLFEVADRGTFFLDEIGDMSAALQVKLLRVLQEGNFIPVGDTFARQVDVRIIAATNRDLRRMVERGEFREDLYYRINVISITAPPLRDRRDDIAELVDFFLQKHAMGRRVRMKRLERGCLARLIEHAWPGNVRELENEIERLVVLAGDERVIGADLLSPKLHRVAQHAARDLPGSATSLPHAVGSLERTMIREALDRCDGNKTRAALDLGISRRNLIRKVSRYKLDRARGPAPRR